jgi:hypothetical protein
MTQPHDYKALQHIARQPRNLWCRGSCRTCDCRGNDDCPVVTEHRFRDGRWACAACGTYNMTEL